MALRIESSRAESETYRGERRQTLTIERGPLAPHVISSLRVKGPRKPPMPRSAIATLLNGAALLLALWLVPDAAAYVFVVGLSAVTVVIIYEMWLQHVRARRELVKGAGYDRTLRIVIEGSDVVESSDGNLLLRNMSAPRADVSWRDGTSSVMVQAQQEPELELIAGLESSEAEALAAALKKHLDKAS